MACISESMTTEHEVHSGRMFTDLPSASFLSMSLGSTQVGLQGAAGAGLWTVGSLEKELNMVGSAGRRPLPRRACPTLKGTRGRSGMDGVWGGE